MLDAEMPQLDLPSGVRPCPPPRAAEVLTHDALALVADLVRRFRPRASSPRGAARAAAPHDAGERPGLLGDRGDPARATGSSPPCRTSRSTGGDHGPVHREVIVNALNSGANVFSRTSRTRALPPGATSSRAK